MYRLGPKSGRFALKSTFSSYRVVFNIIFKNANQTNSYALIKGKKSKVV